MLYGLIFTEWNEVGTRLEPGGNQASDEADEPCHLPKEDLLSPSQRKLLLKEKIKIHGWNRGGTEMELGWNSEAQY